MLAENAKVGWFGVVLVTALLCAVALLPWGATREWQVVLSMAVVAVIALAAGRLLRACGWIRLALVIGLTAGLVFVVGEFIHKGENWWILGFLMYVPVAIVVAAMFTGIGRVFSR